MKTDIWKELAISAEKTRKEYDSKVNPTEANNLIEKIMGYYEDWNEYIKIGEEVKKFFNSDAPEREKNKVSAYTEHLAMMIAAAKSK